MTPEQLRASILQQAMEGKLVEQDPNDEPASVLLEKIAEEKARLIREKKTKRTKKLPEITDDEKPFEIPDSWEWAYVQDYSLVITDYVANGSFKTLRENTHKTKIDGYALFVRTQDLSNNFSTKIFIDKASYDFLDKSKLFGGEVILPNIGGSIGKVFRIPNMDIPMSLAPNSVMLKFMNMTTNRFFEFFIKSAYGKQLLDTIKGGSATPKFSKTELRESLLPVPPLAEQKRIVTKLDQLMSLVDEYAEAYDKLKKLDDGFNDKLKQSLLQYAMEGKLVKQDPNDEPASELLKKIKDEKKQLVKEKKIKRSKSLPRISEDEKLFDIPENWEWVRLKDITNFGNFNSVAGQDIQEGSWVLNMEDIIKNGGGFNKFTIKKLNDDFKSNKYIVEVGDVLYGKLRPYLRKIEIAPKNGFTTTEMFPIKVINQNLISPYYLRYVMLSPYFANRINGSTYGMKMPRVGTKYLASMLIPLPPFEEQKRIVTKVEKMMALVK